MDKKTDNNEALPSATHRNTGRLENIPLDHLMPSSLNSFPMDEIEELAESILRFGLLMPLTVIESSECGTYEILSGVRRFHALALLHEKDSSIFATIPCFIMNLDGVSDAEKELTIFLMNFNGRTECNTDSYRFKVVDLLLRLSSNGTYNRRDLAKILAKSFGFTDRYARMYLKVCEQGTDDLKSAVLNTERTKSKGKKISNQQHITIAQAEKICALPAALQNEVIRKIREGNKYADALKEAQAKAAREINGNPSPMGS